jgi:rRNA maturation endonuclease Nob1
MDIETKRLIYEAYIDPTLKVSDIAKQYGVCNTTVANIAVELGATHRMPKRPKASTSKCNNCRRRVDVKGAKFCPYCGNDLRGPAELLIERINSARGALSLLPESARDEFQTLFVDIVAVLQAKR